MERLASILVLIPLLGGCYIFPTCGSGECPDPEPVELGLYEIDGSEREDVVEGVLDVGEDTVILEYVDDQGNVWEVEYAVTSRTPEEPLYEPWD